MRDILGSTPTYTAHVFIDWYAENGKYGFMVINKGTVTYLPFEDGMQPYGGSYDVQYDSGAIYTSNADRQAAMYAYANENLK